jgi:hypothetical protein
VLVTPFGTFRGSEEIRTYYADFVEHTPGFAVTYAAPTVAYNTAVSRDLVASDPFREAGAARVVIIHTFVVADGRIVALTAIPDRDDPITAAFFTPSMPTAVSPEPAS